MNPITVLQELIENFYAAVPYETGQELIGRGRQTLANLQKLKEASRLDAPYPCPICLSQNRQEPGMLTVEICRETDDFGHTLSAWPEFSGTCEDERSTPENGRVYRRLATPINHAMRLTDSVYDGEFSADVAWLMGMRRQRREVLRMFGVPIDERW